MRLFRRSRNTAVIDRLYSAIVAASRHPALYRDIHVPDSFEGRFECLSLHAILVLRRLNGLPAPGPEMAQALVDTVFKHFDRTLREMGVGDTSVPKRMKSLAEAFLGRSAAYDTAIRSGDEALAAALARNIYAGNENGLVLARYVVASAAAFDEAPLQVFIDGAALFPDPAAVATELTT